MSSELPLYRQVLGAGFDKLAPMVSYFHCRQGRAIYSGETEVQGPQCVGAKLLALLLGTPRQSGKGTIRFELLATAQEERWTRIFFGSTMTSTLSVIDGKLVEHLGAAKLCFTLAVEDGNLRMGLVEMSFLGIPCPRWLMPRIVAEESEQQGRFCFSVEAYVPLVGRVVSYRGFLEPVSEEALR